MSRVADLARGFPGHPSHPPFTDAAIGALTASVLMMLLGWIGIEEQTMVRGGFIVLLLGLAAGVGAALTGLLDFLLISRGTPLWRTAASHLAAMVVAMVLFTITAWLLHGGWDSGQLPVAAAIVGLVAMVTLAVGGWIGGTIVFVHGMRVENEPDRPASEAMRPHTD